MFRVDYCNSDKYNYIITTPLSVDENADTDDDTDDIVVVVDDDDAYDDDGDDDWLRSVDHILIYYKYESMIIHPWTNGPCSINQISNSKRLRFGRFVIITLFKLIEAEWRIYASVNYTIIVSDNSLSPVPRQPIILTNDCLLSTGPQGRYFNEILF